MLSQRRPTVACPRPKRLNARCLRLEALEDRTLPAIITVTNLLDSGPGSLRAAVAAANNSDTIVFSVTGTIDLTSGLISVNNDITIAGPGANELAISGQGQSMIFDVNGTLNNDVDRDDSWILEVAIPFKAYRRALPDISLPHKPGDAWRLNLNRCGGKTNEQFSQWSPGTEKEPQFHSPRDFGIVRFSGEKMPF